MEDIAPKLYEKIKKEFDRKISDSKRLSTLSEKLAKGIVTYREAHEFAIESGKILSQTFQNNLSSSVLPNGKLYYNIADRILRPMMGELYEGVADYSKEVQTVMNKQQNIGIKAIKSELNEDKVQGIIDITSGKEHFDDIEYMLGEPLINFAQTIVDDTVRANADFQYKSGLRPKIIRTSTGKCCKWCDNLAGVYDYEDVSDTGNDVFRRHKHCRCLVEYDAGDRKRANVHTKKERIVTHIQPTEKEAKNASKLKSLAFSEAKKIGLNPLSEEKAVNVLRGKSKKWIEDLTDSEKKAITKYTFNGTDADGKKLYEKINGYLADDYIAADEKEENMLLDFYAEIKGAILKNELENDIIVYRRDYSVSSLQGKTEKFLSTSMTTKGAFGGNPNVAIIVPKGTEGAYIELLSKMPKQREFLFCDGINLKEVSSKDGLTVFEVIKDG